MIIHIITSLHVGGAEMMLYKLLSRLDEFESQVICLQDEGPIGERITNELGIRTRYLHMRASRLPLQFWRLVAWLRQDRPALVQTWMFHADLIGGLAATFAGRPPVVWNVRNIVLDTTSTKRSTVWTIRLCGRLAKRVPTRIIFNSTKALDLHTPLGYPPASSMVIPNGFDTTTFRPDPIARQALRRELNLSDSQPLIGFVARFHPQKDHRNFVQAADHIQREQPDAHFLLCGAAMTWDNTTLAGWIDQHDLRSNFHLLGQRDDTPRINAALDVMMLSSRAEGFPNVVGEAMACGVPCVVTDVGDAAMIVDDTGRGVPPADSLALAEACLDLLRLPPDERQALGNAARHRIETNYSLPVIVERYQDLYTSLLNRNKGN